MMHTVTRLKDGGGEGAGDESGGARCPVAPLRRSAPRADEGREHSRHGDSTLLALCFLFINIVFSPLLLHQAGRGHAGLFVDHVRDVPYMRLVCEVLVSVSCVSRLPPVSLNRYM